MAHFAHVNNGIVDSVIVIDESVINENKGWYCPLCGVHIPLKEWVQTSYNTHEGVHRQRGVPLRKNFAGIGYTYDKEKDAFIKPKPFETWVLNDVKGVYEAPIAMPKDGKPYRWSEETTEWKEVTFSQIKPK